MQHSLGTDGLCGDYVSPQQLVSHLKKRAAKVNYPTGIRSGTESSNHFSPTAYEANDDVWPLDKSSNHLAASESTLGNNLAKYDNVVQPANLNVRKIDYNTLANSSPLTNGFLLTDTSSFHPVSTDRLFTAEDCYPNIEANVGTFPKTHEQASLNIVPITVINSDNSISVAPNLARQGNSLVTQTANNILQQPDKRTLTTGNYFPNYYDVGRQNINNIDNIDEHDITINHKLGLSSESNNYTSSESEPISKQDQDNLAAMSYYSGSGRTPNPSGKMTVKPLGNDSFMLSVEDTGINPHRLQQQIVDRAAEQPITQQRWDGNMPHRYPPYERQPARRVDTVSNIEGVPAQPFMVTWSENGLPRINMMSTPWLSNTLSRQRKAPTHVSTPDHQQHPQSGFMDLGGRNVGYESMAGSPQSYPDKPPTPPPRSVHRLPENVGFVSHSQQPKFVHERFNNASPSPPMSTEMIGGTPHNSYMTLPAKNNYYPTVTADIIDPRYPRGADYTLPRSRPNAMKINAPVAIDVKQVPAAGKHLQPQLSSNSMNDITRIPVKPPELPPRRATSVPKETDCPPILRPSGPTADHIVRSSSPRSEPSPYISVRQGRPASHRGDERARSPYITVRQEKPTPDTTPYITMRKAPAEKDTFISVKRVDRDDEIPTFKLSTSSPSSTAVPRFHDTLPRPTRADKPDANTLVPQSNDDDGPPRPKSPSGYLQSFLREYKRRSPSPARKTASSSHERGRDRGRERGKQRESRSERESRSDRRMRSPSPMPQQSREVVFNDEIDWNENSSSSGRSSQTVDWDQIEAVMR